jgi:thioredoxin-dependent peroxiredoxin
MKTVGLLTEALSPFFYPKIDTTDCTKEACAFRDDHEQFGDPRAEVIRVASDSV